MQSTLTWSEGMRFLAEADGHAFVVDTTPEAGGQGTGPRPKALLLTAVAGCTAMDVVHILKKMRLQPTSFAVDARAEARPEHPRVFEEITLVYRFEGDLPVEKLVRAIELSEEKYCAVSAMVRPGVPIAWELWLNGERVVPALAAA